MGLWYNFVSVLPNNVGLDLSVFPRY